MKESAIQPTRKENYAEWYQQVIKAADLAEHALVRGCMTLKPWGYSLWESIQTILGARIKALGHQNVYLPLLIPLSHLQKEAEHVAGFAKECAVVTHHRLDMDLEGQLHPGSPLEEALVVRPTSETVVGEAFSRWIVSYRDLPLRINQWANIMRWERRPRLFLRTSEFLWQEGHTAHATREEAEAEARKMLRVYKDFAQDILAIPVIVGEKSENERFPGALSTLTIEAMMQDGKALQSGTSHFLGQNFAKASDILFQTQEGEREYAWTTSWGVSTRLIGALIMVHSDDDGLVVPPKISSVQGVILPVLHKEGQGQILQFCETVAQLLSKEGSIFTIDQRDIRGGEKKWEWIKKGVPIRMEIGMRDVDSQSVVVYRRDCPHNEKSVIPLSALEQKIPLLLEEIQENMYRKAVKFLEKYSVDIDSKEDFYDFFAPKGQGVSESIGGFAFTHWSGDLSVVEKLQADLGVTVRCIPFSRKNEPGICPFTQQRSAQRVLFAKAY